MCATFKPNKSVGRQKIGDPEYTLRTWILGAAQLDCELLSEHIIRDAIVRGLQLTITFNLDKSVERPKDV